MTSFQKQRAIVIAIVVGALAILITTFVANGSEREDAWLYVTAGVVALLPLVTVRARPKHKD